MELLFFDMGSGEILLIVVVVFLVFGPSKIPELARGLGKFINEIKRASEDVKNEINREADRQERENKLSDYKKKMEEELNVNNENKVVPQTDNKEPKQRKTKPEGTDEDTKNNVK